MEGRGCSGEGPGGFVVFGFYGGRGELFNICEDFGFSGFLGCSLGLEDFVGCIGLDLQTVRTRGDALVCEP